MEIIGHRGALYMAPENTLASVKLAWTERADAVEVDVHRSADGRLMVIHDHSTKRTTGVDLIVAETGSEELRKLDAGAWKSPDFAGEKIPFLEEVVATIPGGKRLFVEVKCGPECIDDLAGIIKSAGRQSAAAVIGFDLDTITAFKRRLPGVPVYWLRVSDREDSGRLWQPYQDSLIETAARAGLDGLDLHYGGITPALVQNAKSAGMRVYAWTVNDPGNASRLQEMGVDGIGTDCPGWMVEQLAIRGRQAPTGF